MDMQSTSSEILTADGTNTVQLVMIILGIAALAFLLISTRRRIMNSTRQPTETPREQFTRRGGLSRTTREVERVMAELDSLSREIHGRIDTKLARLEKLLRDADQRIALLSQPVDSSADRGSRLEILLEQEEPLDVVSGDDNTGDATQQSVVRMAEVGRSVLEIAQHVGKTPGEIELMLALHKTRIEGEAGSPAGVHAE